MPPGVWYLFSTPFVSSPPLVPPCACVVLSVVPAHTLLIRLSVCVANGRIAVNLSRITNRPIDLSIDPAVHPGLSVPSWEAAALRPPRSRLRSRRR